MKVCKNCGKENKDIAIFCGYCGTRLEDEVATIYEVESEQEDVPETEQESEAEEVPNTEPEPDEESALETEPELEEGPISKPEPEPKKTPFAEPEKQKTIYTKLIVAALLIICVVAVGVFVLKNKGKEGKADLPECFVPIQLLDQAYAEDSPDILKKAVCPDFLERFHGYEDTLSECSYREDIFIKAEELSPEKAKELAKETLYKGDPDERYQEYYSVITHCNQTIGDNNTGFFIDYLIGNADGKWEILSESAVLVELSDIDTDWSLDTLKLINACSDGDLGGFYKQTIAQDVVNYKLASPFIDGDLENEIMIYLEDLKNIRADRLVYAQKLTDQELEDYKTEVRKMVDEGIGNYDLGDSIGGMIESSISKTLDKSTEGIKLAFDNVETDTRLYDFEILMLKVGNDWKLGWIY